MKTHSLLRLSVWLGVFLAPPALAQLSGPNLQPGLVVHPGPQPVVPDQPANLTSRGADLVQWRGQNEGDPDFSSRVVKSQEGWSRLWRQLGRPAPQAFDERREMAVFIALGTRPTGGFRPQILGAQERDGQWVVVYSEGKPSRDSYVTQALTQPWVVALVPFSSLPVRLQLQDGQ